MKRTYIALGGNLGDVPAVMGNALGLLEDAGCVVTRASRVFETEPWGGDEQPNYANAVVEVDVPLSAPDLLDLCKEIEVKLGRMPAEPNTPRPIDLDILLLEDEEWDSPDLTIPHQRMAERDFVITPLLEVAPHATWPDGSPITRDAVAVGRVTGVVGEIPGYADRTAVPMPDQPVEDIVLEIDDESEWTAVYEFGADPTLFGLAASAVGGNPSLMGKRPNVAASFAQMILEQASIPYAWDPFAPENASDPYGFTRRYRLLVQASRAEEAARLLLDASAAPLDWSDADLGE